MCSGGGENTRDIKVKVNGKDVSLNPFATNILGNAIWAMITCLRLEEKPTKVEIEISE
jgi:hypothetical protein